MSIKLAEEKKAVLRDRLAALEQEAMYIKAEIAKLDTYIDVERVFESERNTSPPQTGEHATLANSGQALWAAEPPRVLDERFRHKSYKSATCLVLDIEGRAMSSLDIADRLTQAGIVFVAKDPTRSVFSALAAASRDGSVRRTPDGLWELVPEAERKSRIMTKQVDSLDLSEKTRLGLSRAKERGVKLGVREKMTDDQRALVITMAADGMSIPTMAGAVGFSVAGLSKWMSRNRIQRSVGTPPPEQRAETATSSPTALPQPSEQSPDADLE